MTNESPKPIVKPDSLGTTESELENDDIVEDGDYVSLVDGLEQETRRRDARRKIEIYWEKKRLKDQLDDFDESEFDF